MTSSHQLYYCSACHYDVNSDSKLIFIQTAVTIYITHVVDILKIWKL